MRFYEFYLFTDKSHLNWGIECTGLVVYLLFVPFYLGYIFMDQINDLFTKYVLENWDINNHSEIGVSCVYAVIAIDIMRNTFETVYIGSTVDFYSRWKTHKIPDRVEKDSGRISIALLKKMDKGFYDYEIKLIKRLKPLYNKQHKHGA